MEQISAPSAPPPAGSPAASPSIDWRALVLSAIPTALLLMIIIGMGPAARPAPDAAPDITLFAHDLPEAPQPEPPRPQKRPEREIIADSREESAPAPAPLAIVSAPDLPIVPVPQIRLAPLQLPEIPEADRGRILTEGTISDGDRDTGVRGPVSKGGAGSGGKGAGGRGSGRGKGSRLIASWAPRMDFKRLDSYYPEAAKGTGARGLALLKCKVLRRDLVRDCSLVGEHPEGLGFGEAALSAEKILRVRVHNQAGRRIYDEWIIFEAVFRKPAVPAPVQAEAPAEDVAPVAASAD